MTGSANLSSKINFSVVQAGIIFVLAFGLRFGFFLIKGIRAGGDTADYLKLADNIYRFGAYSLKDFPNLSLTIRRPPLYPYFLAFLQWIEGGALSLQSVIVIQSVLDSLTAVVVFLLVKKVVSKPLALLTAFFYAVHPGAISHTNTILTESLFAFLLALAALAFVYAFDKEKIWLVVLGTITLGLAVLCRPTWIFVPFLLVVITLFKFKSAKRYLFSAVTVVVFSLTLLPWLIRCYQVAGQFVLVQSSSSINFYLPTRVDLEQWNEEKLWKIVSDPNTDDPFFKKLMTAQTPAEVLEVDKFGRQQAIENIKNSPKKYVLSRLQAYPHLFLSSFDSFTGIHKSFGDVWRRRDFFGFGIKAALLFIFAFLPFLLSLVGLLRSAGNLTAMLCASVWLFILLIHVPMWIEYRYWTPAIPFQLVSAAVGLAILKVIAYDKFVVPISNQIERIFRFSVGKIS